MKIPESAIELLSSGVIVHVATIDEDGKPQVTCAWVDVDENELRIATMFDQRKLKNMRRDARVTVSVASDKTHDFGLREYVVIYGRASLTEGGAAELLQKLAATYIGPDAVFPGMPEPPPGFIVHVTPERIAGVGPWAKS